MKKTNQEETRQHNSRLVLQTLYRQGQSSRVDVARQTGLTRTTVSDIVAEYLQAGLLVESGLSPSTGGKPAILLQIDPQSRLLAGLDLANSELRGALIDLRGRAVYRRQIPIEERAGEAALALVFELVADLLAQASQPVLGVGIGVPGLIDARLGWVRQAVNLDWHELPLQTLLAERFKLPIYLSNDSQAAALGEYTFGESSSRHNLIVVKVGRGIGAGFILQGELFHGDQGSSGELGHIQVDPQGAPCRCGNRGCLETRVSSRALIRQAAAWIQAQPGTQVGQLAAQAGRLDTEVLLQAYRQGDPQVIAMLTQAGHELGVVLRHLVSALNINQVVIAGSLSRFGAGLTGPIQASLRRGILPALAATTQVSTSSLGEDIVILGAASLILKNELGISKG